MRGFQHRRLVEHRRVIAAVLAAGIALTACTSRSSTSSAGTAAGKGGGDTTFTLMEFNIEYGGDGVDFQSVIDAIELADPDVVGIEEPYGNIPKIAEELGWQYFDEKRQLVSQIPLKAPADGSPLYSYVEIRPGGFIAIADVHLTSSPYGPNIIARKGADLEEVLSVEKRQRVPEITPVIETLAHSVEAEVPSFVLGDFNTPSHLDWTQDMVGARPQIKFPVEWPVTKALEDAGFADSYRTLYPDASEDPGITWPAMRPKIKGEWNPSKTSLQDRIDLIFSAGPASVTDSYVMGEEGADVEKTVSPWPTDHRAIVSTFQVTPAEIPPPAPFVRAEPQLVTGGKDLTVTFYAPEDGSKVAVVPEGGDPPAEVVAEQATSAGTAVEGSEPAESLTFDTSGWKAEAHDVLLVDGSGTELSRTPIWIRNPGDKVQIGAVKGSYAVGEPIDIEWYGAPAGRWDWIGIYSQGADPQKDYYLMWAYTRATVAGEATFGRPAAGKWPLPAGQYTVFYLLNDGYRQIAGGDFAIKG